MCLVLLILFSFFFVSCNTPKRQNREIDGLFNKVDSLKYIEVSNEYVWGSPLAMQYVDSVVFVYDEKADNGLFHLVKCVKTDSVIDFGKKGQGKNEFIMPLDFQIVNKDTLSIFDFSNKNLYLLDLKETMKKNLDFFVCFKDTIPNTVKVLLTKYNSFVSFGFYKDCMFKLRNKQGETLEKIGNFPYRDMHEQKCDNRLKGMAYQGVWKSNPLNDKFVYAVNSADILYFYHIDSLNVTLSKKYEFSYPDYQVRERGIERAAPMSVNNKKSFISLTTTDELVFLLYSGKSFKEAGLKALEGDILYVFDWEGNPVKKYLLDVPITQLCVNKEGNELYAFSNMANPTLVKFNL